MSHLYYPFRYCHLLALPLEQDNIRLPQSHRYHCWLVYRFAGSFRRGCQSYWYSNHHFHSHLRWLLYKRECASHCSELDSVRIFIRWTFQALTINEFRGLVFSCSGSSNGACVTTGEEVLDTLGFGGHTPQPAIFGLSMVFIGFLLLLFISLEISRIKYMPLGYKGRLHKPSEKEKAPSLKQVSDSVHA